MDFVLLLLILNTFFVKCCHTVWAQSPQSLSPRAAAQEYFLAHNGSNHNALSYIELQPIPSYSSLVLPKLLTGNNIRNLTLTPSVSTNRVYFKLSGTLGTVPQISPHPTEHHHQEDETDSSASAGEN